MTQLEVERLTKFCNKITIKVNRETGGYYSYFEYKDKYYYASICLVKHGNNDKIPEIAIFPACDDYVTSWVALYCKKLDDVSVKLLRKHIYIFLESIIENLKHNHKQNNITKREVLNFV